MCSYCRCSFLLTPLRCFLPGMTVTSFPDGRGLLSVESFQNASKLARMARLVGCHVFQLHFQFCLPQFLGDAGMLGVIPDVLEFQFQVLFQHVPQIVLVLLKLAWLRG